MPVYNKEQSTILLFGANGQVGRCMARQMKGLGSVVACVNRNVSRTESQAPYAVDLRDEKAIRRIFGDVIPQIVVNAAAYTDVDRAETEPDQARAVNALAPAVLAQEAARIGALLVHFSTDYVFDGGGDRPWRETDHPHPINMYGQSKLDGERAVRSNCPRHLILRTSWIYGTAGRNFFTNLLRNALKTDELPMAADQVGAPTTAQEAARLACHAMRVVAAQEMFYGTYHATSGGCCSRYEFALEFLAVARRLGFPLQTLRLRPVRLTEFKSLAPRPLNCRLNCQRFRNRFGILPNGWRQGLRETILIARRNQYCGDSTPLSSC